MKLLDLGLPHPHAVAHPLDVVRPGLDPQEGRLEGALAGLEVLRDPLEPLPLLLDPSGRLRRALLRDCEGLPVRGELDLPGPHRLLPGPDGVQPLRDLRGDGRVRGGEGIQLRLAPPKNQQRALIHWASDYELGAVIEVNE